LNKARSEKGLPFISFHMPKGVGRPILALASYFEQFYPYLPDYAAFVKAQLVPFCFMTF